MTRLQLPGLPALAVGWTPVRLAWLTSLSGGGNPALRRDRSGHRRADRDSHNGFMLHRHPIGACTGHRSVSVDNGDDACAQRGVLALQAIRIATAVERLMVGANQACNRCRIDATRSREDVLAAYRMLSYSRSSSLFQRGLRSMSSEMPILPISWRCAAKPIYAQASSFSSQCRAGR